jgi:hypothetical protein
MTVLHLSGGMYGHQRQPRRARAEPARPEPRIGGGLRHSTATSGRWTDPVNRGSDAPVLTIRGSGGGVEVSGPARYLGGAIVAGGPFARWEWNGRALVVENDRHGVFPLFWHASGDAIAVSPSSDGLLRSGVSAALDDAALAVFLRAGYFVGDDTPFAAIRALPPAGRVTWNSVTTTVTSGWTHRPPGVASRHELIEAFADLTARSVARHADASLRPCVVPLSGGHDSRHIAFALREHGVPFSCVTVEPYPPAAGDDVAIARMVGGYDDGDARRFCATMTHRCTSYQRRLQVGVPLQPSQRRHPSDTPASHRQQPLITPSRRIPSSSARHNGMAACMRDLDRRNARRVSTPPSRPRRGSTDPHDISPALASTPTR